MASPSPPPGFTIESQDAPPTLPPGFTIDQAETERRARLAREMSGQTGQPRTPDFIQDMSTAERALAGAGKAFVDIGRGVGQATGVVSQEDIDEARAIDAPLTRTPAGLLGNVAGNVAAFAPTAAIPGANTAAGAAGIGALMGAAQPVPTGGSRLVNTAVGAAGGIAGAGIGRGIGKLATRKVPAGRVVGEAGELTDEAVGRLAVIDDPGVLTPEQAKRFNLFQGRGVTPTRANVTQSIDDFVGQQSGIKRAGQIADVVSEQDQQLIDLAERGVADIGPASQTLPEASARVFAATDDVVTRVDEAVGAAYDAARVASKGQPGVRIDSLAKSLSDARGNEKVSGGVISAVRGLLKNKGLLRKGSSLDVNKGGPRFTADDARLMTVDEAEEIRQGLNALHDSVSPQGRRLIRQFKDALDLDVESAVGADVFADARAAKTAFGRLIERGRRNKFDRTKGGFLEDVIDNKIPEEKIIPRLINGRDDDFAKFKTFLTEDAGENGVQAWQDIKAQVLRNAIDKATRTAGKGEGGQSVFNARLFRNALDPLRKTKKFEGLFNADERQLIDDIVEIGQLRTPISSVQQGTGPSGLAIEEARRALFRQIPFIGERAEGIVAAVSDLRQAKAALDPVGRTISRLRIPDPGRVGNAGRTIVNLATPAALLREEQ